MLAAMPRRKKSRKPTVLISSSQQAVRVPRKRITELVAFVAAAEGAPLAEMDIAVVTSRHIAQLNRRYLNRTGATDVLSFDLSDPGERAVRAQIVVCGDEAAAQAGLHKCGVQRELMLYVVHGLLHLMGYNDKTKSAAAAMYARQEELLHAFLGRGRAPARPWGPRGQAQARPCTRAL